jgi:RNA-splicing ligase RtcB
MLELKGQFNTAKVFTDNAEQSAIAQIENLLNQEFVAGSKIRIMPDVHAGMGCTIGTTMTVTDKIVPNLVGVDIGCGMETVLLNDKRVELQQLGRGRKSKNKDRTLAYLEGEQMRDYLHDMELITRYADLNRKAIVRDLEKRMKLKIAAQFTTIHNYIDTQSMILRKGAVSAKAGEKLLIPMNMRDGSLLCVGKGNSDWNFSAPHGAGRLMSRSEAKASITLSEFEKSMKGIYSSSVNKSTIDESPFAYKAAEEIIANIGDTAEVVKVIKPVYNFKAGQD